MFKNCHSILGVLKLAATVNKNAKTTFRTGTDARGSKQNRRFKTE
ncbi:hypothetical protein HMPREF9554_01743 [Treponema phagedenis F0421]|nr:hypothetical protein HMPREF9554_01743 [Treponema phagedenis F0421]